MMRCDPGISKIGPSRPRYGTTKIGPSQGKALIKIVFLAETHGRSRDLKIDPELFYRVFEAQHGGL